MSATANEYQVGGDHYRREYQHWDWVMDSRMNYLEGNATKYLVRWKQKNGAEDLKKAIHYTEKLKQWVGDTYFPEDMPYEHTVSKNKRFELFAKFADNLDLDALDYSALSLLATWNHLNELDVALGLLKQQLKNAEKQNGPN